MALHNSAEVCPRTKIRCDPKIDRILHAAEHVVVDNVARDADPEKVANSLIEDNLDRSTRIDAREDHRKRILVARSR